MPYALTKQVTAALAQFSAKTRLYELVIGDEAMDLGSGGLLVEAFVAHDLVNGVGSRDVIVLSTNAGIEPTSLLGQPATLEISLANGRRTSFCGEVSEAAMLGSDGGFARYRLRISSWLWRLDQVRHCRMWQDQSVINIVDSVFEAYLPLARWRWSDETPSFMANVPARGYCCQYRESDLDFVRRILAEEGLNWRFEQADDGPSMVLFANSSRSGAVPEDPCSEMDGGIRYHRAGAVEHQDTVQALIAQRRLHASLTTVLSYDHGSKQIVAAGSPSLLPVSKALPELETYDVAARRATTSEQARRYADLQMEAQEARAQAWRGRSTVRTLRAGTSLTITGAPLQALGDAPAFTVLHVASVGVNNLPPPARHALAELFGSVPELLQEIAREQAPDDMGLVVAQAVESGYANCFEAIPAAFSWRPLAARSDGDAYPKPVAMGAQSAIVIGPDGSDQPNGPGELYCDRMGRVRIRFHWQDGGDKGCWVRVAQRAAAGGMGSQFLPRIGQEVLVQFLENDIDQPVIVGALYNGQGEGGIAPTPGGRTVAGNDEACFARAHDHARSAQGNLAGGNSPVWHGAAGASHAHRNAAAQWGLRSKEFGGSGYNQLLFDDTDGQGRVQLKCSHAATELSLGHLIHAADNYRGSFRGLGAQLRTDAYGAVRAAGLLVSSYTAVHGAMARDAVGENAAAIGLLKQAGTLAEVFDSSARTHLAVGLASHQGAAKSHASTLDDRHAPLQAMLASVSGTVSRISLADALADAAGRSTAVDADKLPHSCDPILTLASRDDLGADAAQDLQLVSGETVVLMSGLDTQFANGGQVRLQTGQAIGTLAAATKAGADGTGLQLMTAKDPIDLQAQLDDMRVQARDDVRIVSANANIDWAAAKKISLSTAGGAHLTIEGGNITVQCPGKITAHAGKKSLSDPAKLDFEMPALPRSVCIACLKKSLAAAPAFTMVE